MGEIAEMMLDGTLCESCGVALGGEPSGYPQYCSPQCAEDAGFSFKNNQSKMKKPMERCPYCAKMVKEVGLAQHIRDKHGKNVPTKTEEAEHNAQAAKILRMASRLLKLINIDPQFMGTVEACDISEAEWKQMKAWAADWSNTDQSRGGGNG